MLGELEDKMMNKIKKINKKNEEIINSKISLETNELKNINKNLNDLKDLIKELNDNIKNIQLGPLDNIDNYKKTKNKKDSNKDDFIPSIDTKKMSYKKTKKSSKNVDLDEDLINSINSIKNDKGK